jgi:ParB-like nuclease domain
MMWLDPLDCDPPHGLDLDEPHHYEKVNALIAAFDSAGFDRSKSALVGYPLDGRVQLLSGTHRREAAIRAGIKIPVTMWLRSDVERAWGDLDKWRELIRDVGRASS